MKAKDIILELSKLPEDLDILSIEIEGWQAYASWNDVDYEYLNSEAIILYIKNYD